MPQDDLQFPVAVPNPPGSDDALRLSEERLRFAIEGAELGSWDWDIPAGELVWSERCRALFGIGLDETVSYQRFLDAVHPEDRNRVHAAVTDALASGADYKVEMRVVWPDGTVHWLNARGRAFRSPDGKPLRMSGVALEITELKETQEALRKAEESATRTLSEIESIYQSAPVGLALFDTALRFVRVNPAFARMNGFSPEEHRGKTPGDLNPDFADAANSALAAVLHSGQPVLNLEVRGATAAEPGVIRSWNEHWIPFCDADGRVLGISVSVEETTERAAREAALRKSEERFRALVMATSDVIYRMNSDWTEMRFLRGLDFIPDTDQPSRSWLKRYIPPEERELVLTAIAGAIRSRGVFELEHRVYRVDGSVGWTFSRAVPLLSAEGEITEWFGAATDITLRKEAEAASRQSEARERERASELSGILEAVPVALFISQDCGASRIIGSRLTYELLRAVPGSNLSLRAGDGQTPPPYRATRNGQDIPVDELPLRLAASTGRAIRNYEFEMVRADGSTLNLLGDAVPLIGDDGTPRGAVAAFIDITERKRAEEHFQQTQKLESIGLLAGGIAHDFNNLLTGVMGNASLLLEDAPADWDEPLRAIISSTERAAHLTRQLLAYSGQGQFIVRDLDVTQAVTETADLVQFSIPKSAALSLNLERRLPFVSMDPGQLQQIVMNLVINAGEAIGEGKPGRITVTTSMSDFENSFNDDLGQEVAPGRYVCIEVGDTGIGIDPALKGKIFDPFFTTKFVGRGLGLAAVAGILRSQKGGVIVRSSPHLGSIFRVYLPAVARKSSGKSGAPQGGWRGTVLVIDDEVSVRKFLGSALRKRGYRVLEAADGHEALAACASENEAIAIAIVDIIMPSMSANDLVATLTARRPEIKILLTSGYSEAEARRLCAEFSGAAFIQKPYTVQALEKAFRSLLPQRDPPATPD